MASDTGVDTAAQDGMAVRSLIWNTFLWFSRGICSGCFITGSAQCSAGQVELSRLDSYHCSASLVRDSGPRTLTLQWTCQPAFGAGSQILSVLSPVCSSCIRLPSRDPSCATPNQVTTTTLTISPSRPSFPSPPTTPPPARHRRQQC